ncbi:hypothetical protein [Bartonella sp. B39]
MGGEAIGIVLRGTVLQKVALGGYVKDLTINEKIKSWLQHGANIREKHNS